MEAEAMTYRLGIELGFGSEDAGDLARMLRDLADWLDEEGVVPGPVLREGVPVGRVIAEVEP